MRNITYNRYSFPPGFQFGIASSSYQIEGHQFGGAGTTHWDSFAATPGNVIDQANGSLACDHFHHYQSDIELAANAGFDAWRFSTSWTRIIPDGTGEPNLAGLDYYDRLVDTICANQMTPHLTLYHWELPSPLADIGGWANHDISTYFAAYAEIIMRCIGDRIQFVAPINEPWCVAWLSYFMGQHAPGLKDIRATARAMHHVLLAHGKAVQAIRTNSSAKIGFVANVEYSEPADQRPESLAAAHLYDQIYNQWFLSGVRRRHYPKKALAGLEPHLPRGWENDFDVIAEPLEWIGLNYYTRKLITLGPSRTFGDFNEVKGGLPKTQMGWEIYSPGLLHLLSNVWENYADGLPLYVTENGMANDDQLIDNSIDDTERISFINEHLRSVHDAISKGIDLRGYFVWTLLDNYEWTFGYDKKFGIVHVDRDTMKRTPKKSYLAIQEALNQ